MLFREREAMENRAVKEARTVDGGELMEGRKGGKGRRKGWEEFAYREGKMCCRFIRF